MSYKYAAPYLSFVTLGTSPIFLPSLQSLAMLRENITLHVVLEVSGCPPGLGTTLTVYVKVSLLSSDSFTPRLIFKSTVFPSEFMVTLDLDG